MNTGEDFEDEVNKIRGNVITVMGIPNDKSPQAVIKLVNEISEIAINNMRDVEVAHMTDIPIITAGVVKKYADADDDEVMATPTGRAAASIFHGYMESLDLDGEKEEERRLTTLTDEEREEEDQRHRENWKRIEKQAHERTLHEIQEGVANAFDVAEKWSKTPDLTVREVAHGVAHDLHSHYVYDHGKAHELFPERPREYPTPSAGYQSHYTAQFEDEIKSRQMRAAQALFGKKG